MAHSTTQLYDPRGRRKYLNRQERKRFLKAANSQSFERKVFCQVLLFTGCRISEALQLTRERIDFLESVLVFQTLKRRSRKHQRAVPIPDKLLRDLRKLVADNTDEKIWSFSRTTGWRIIKEVMKAAGIEGEQATAKGLRHGFGIACAEQNIPISLISNWMGHSNLATTGIYLDAVGMEERQFIKRTW